MPLSRSMAQTISHSPVLKSMAAPEGQTAAPSIFCRVRPMALLRPATTPLSSTAMFMMQAAASAQTATRLILLAMTTTSSSATKSPTACINLSMMAAAWACIRIKINPAYPNTPGFHSFIENNIIHRQPEYEYRPKLRRENRPRQAHRRQRHYHRHQQGWATRSYPEQYRVSQQRAWHPCFSTATMSPFSTTPCIRIIKTRISRREG